MCTSGFAPRLSPYWGVDPIAETGVPDVRTGETTSSERP